MQRSNLAMAGWSSAAMASRCGENGVHGRLWRREVKRGVLWGALEREEVVRAGNWARVHRRRPILPVTEKRKEGSARSLGYKTARRACERSIEVCHQLLGLDTQAAARQRARRWRKWRLRRQRQATHWQTTSTAYCSDWQSPFLTLVLSILQSNFNIGFKQYWSSTWDLQHCLKDQHLKLIDLKDFDFWKQALWNSKQNFSSRVL
jgi:hypothetical protein